MGRAGATLVELLVALAILSIGMAGVMGMLSLTSRVLQHAELSFRAALVATGAEGEADEEGETSTSVGTFHWRRLSPWEIEVRFEGPGGGPGPREWSWTGDGPDPGEPPSWSFWSP